MSEDWAIDRLKEEFAIMTTYANRGSILAMLYFSKSIYVLKKVNRNSGR